MGKPVRMADIAEKLNISIVSVSKALAGKPGVSEEMRAKIVALARQMGYEGVRNHSEPGTTGNIGVLVADRLFDESSFYSNLYRFLVLSGGNEGFTSMLEIVSPNAERTVQLPALVTGRKVDGLIFMGNISQTYLQTVTASGLPCVLLDFHAAGHALDCVVSDNVDGGCALTEHLLAQGFREIGFVGSIRGPPGWSHGKSGCWKTATKTGLTSRWSCPRRCPAPSCATATKWRTLWWRPCAGPGCACRNKPPSAATTISASRPCASLR